MGNTEEREQVIFELHPEKKRKLKMVCAMRGMSIKEVCEEAVDDFLQTVEAERG